MGNNKTKEQKSRSDLVCGSYDDNDGNSEGCTVSASYSNPMARKVSASYRVSNREYLSSVMVSSNLDSEIYMHGYTPTLYYDGINPGYGVTKIIENLDSDVNESLDSLQRMKEVGSNAVKLVLKNTLVYKVVSGRLHSHIITGDGRILSFGSNNHGQLACGAIGSLKPSFGVVRAVGEISNHQIIDGAGGGYHSLFLTSDNRVFGVGGNSSQQLGTDTVDNGTAIAVEIPSQSFDEKKVVACAAGDSHSCFLTSCGSIYFAGSNSNGSCAGVRGKTRPLLLVNEMLHNEIPIQISCGYDNTMILCQSGKIFGVGCNSCGQLATSDGDHSNFSDIRLIYQGSKGIIWIGSGYFCSAVCSAEECYFAPSSNTYSLLSEINSNVISVGVGDSVMFATSEINDSGRFGKLYVISSESATDVTGEFSIESLSSQIEFSTQRDIYIAYVSKVDPAFMISHHFINLEKILSFVKGDCTNYTGSSVFSDINIQIDV